MLVLPPKHPVVSGLPFTATLATHSLYNNISPCPPCSQSRSPRRTAFPPCHPPNALLFSARCQGDHPPRQVSPQQTLHDLWAASAPPGITYEGFGFMYCGKLNDECLMRCINVRQRLRECRYPCMHACTNVYVYVSVCVNVCM